MPTASPRLVTRVWAPALVDWLGEAWGCLGELPGASRVDESFQGLLLRHRGRTGLTQRQLAERMGAHMRSVQEWETGGSYPGAERLQALIAALLESGGLQAGSETAEAEALWAAVPREAPRMQTPLDRAWLATLLTRRVGVSTISGLIVSPRSFMPDTEWGSRRVEFRRCRPETRAPWLQLARIPRAC